jgi:hypothetical protein
MNQQKQFLIGFFVVLALALAAAGFYYFSSRSAYKEALSGFDDQRRMISTLERKSPYPNAENVDRIVESVTAYQGEVAESQSKLLTYQKELDETMTQPEFRKKLQDAVSEFEKGARLVGLTLPEDFYMGMQRYRAEIPRKEAVGLLNYQLSSIDNLMRVLANVGATELIEIDRATLPIEYDSYKEEEGAEQAPLEKYPLRIAFSGPHQAFTGVFNQISNDKEFFYIVRYVRIESSMKDGPDRSSAGFFEEPGADFSPGAAAPEESGFFGGDASTGGENPDYDASLIMGQETIKVLAVIDLVRVADLDFEVDASDAEKEVEAEPEAAAEAAEGAGVE